MAGQRELVHDMPPILLTMAVTTTIGGNTTTPLSEARIAGSTDSTYGVVGWTPDAHLTDGEPFAVITSTKGKESQVEVNRVRTTAIVAIFFAVADATVPNVGFNFNDAALAWVDALRLTIPPNRRLSPAADDLEPNVGDVRWEMDDFQIVESYNILGSAWYGVRVDTKLTWTTIVSFQG